MPADAADSWRVESHSSPWLPCFGFIFRDILPLFDFYHHHYFFKLYFLFSRSLSR